MEEAKAHGGSREDHVLGAGGAAGSGPGCWVTDASYSHRASIRHDSWAPRTSDVTLHGKRAFADVIKVRRGHPRLGWVLIQPPASYKRRKGFGQRDTQGGRPGRSYKTHTKGGWETPRSIRRQGQTLSSSLRGRAGYQHPHLRKCKRRSLRKLQGLQLSSGPDQNRDRDLPAPQHGDTATRALAKQLQAVWRPTGLDHRAQGTAGRSLHPDHPHPPINGALQSERVLAPRQPLPAPSPPCPALPPPQASASCGWTLALRKLGWPLARPGRSAPRPPSWLSLRG